MSMVVKTSTRDCVQGECAGRSIPLEWGCEDEEDKVKVEFGRMGVSHLYSH